MRLGSGLSVLRQIKKILVRTERFGNPIENAFTQGPVGLGTSGTKDQWDKEPVGLGSSGSRDQWA